MPALLARPKVGDVKKREVLLDTARRRVPEMVAELEVGEAVSIETDAPIRNSYCAVVYLGEGVYDLTDDRQGDSGDEFDAEDFLAGWCLDFDDLLNDDGRDREKVRVLRFFDEDVDRENGGWKDA